MGGAGLRLRQACLLERTVEGRFTMGAPQRQRRSVERYSIVIFGRPLLCKGEVEPCLTIGRVRSSFRPVSAALMTAGPDGVR
jgi:hypothetical protein